jgi:two-component sensor histidine kinase
MLFREVKQNERRLEAALKQKELLLKEVHHRVKNNLNIVNSLIRLQAARIKDTGIADRLRDLTSRIQSMALVHEKLYQSGDLSDIDLGAYVRDTVDNLYNGYGIDRERIRCDVRSRGGIALTIRQAIPCGMIVNELVTNCLKYAFPGDRSGTIAVEVSLADGVVLLAVRDDGVGLPEGLDIDDGGTLGLSLIRSLAEQISGSVEVGPGPGTSVVVRFPLGG